MKRNANLFNQVVSYDNLQGAFRLAAQGCGRTDAVCRFFFHLETELLKLQKELSSGAYQPGAYYYFSIHDPKKRQIAVAPFRDRVVHHAVISVITPLYEKIFIHDSYATRKGKGTHLAITRAQRFSRRQPFYLKADIKKYFDSVDHEILEKIIARKIKDKKLLALLHKIIANTPVPGKGLPIGNLTSQFLANVYLDPFDHQIKDHLRIKHYLRYMDDFVIFGRSAKELLYLKSELTRFLSDNLKLRFHKRSTYVNRCNHGLSFLGMRIFPNYIRPKPENRRRSLKRMRQKIQAWQKGDLDETKMAQGIESTVAHLRYFSPDLPISLGTAAETAGRIG